MPINYANYHPEWKDRIRPTILKRAGYKCETCKIAHKAIGYRMPDGKFIECDKYMQGWCKTNGIKCIRIILTIAHLNHDVSDNAESNLRALCQKCHNNYDMPFRLLNRITKKKYTNAKRT